jgi:glycosyltransferase involved in cell wall biosynthesis
MPRVLLVHHSSQAGGAENSLLDLVGGLSEEWGALVACPGGGPLIEQLEAAGGRVLPAPIARFKCTACPIQLSRYFLAWRRGVRALVAIIKDAGIDIVHSNTTTAHLYGGAAAARCRVPSVWHIRDTAIPGAAKLILPGASACIAISHYIADHVGPAARPGPDVIHNGVDLDEFHPAQHPPETPTVAMVGQLVPWKNHGDFLRAAARIRKAVPSARFLIVGDDMFGDHPDYRQQLESLAEEAGIAESLDFTGYRHDLPQLLRSVSVLVHPSRKEPFGRAVVEAMASGVPVIAYREGGPAEIISHGNTGLLVRPGDVAQLAAGAISVLQAPDKAARLGEAGRARAEEMFDCRNTARKIMAVYSKLLEGRR